MPIVKYIIIFSIILYSFLVLYELHDSKIIYYTEENQNYKEDSKKEPHKDVFQKIGPFGDTIGGLLSPIIGLITIYFVYLSYNKQQETHALELNTVNYQIVNQTLEDLLIRHSQEEDKTFNLKVLETYVKYNFLDFAIGEYCTYNTSYRSSIHFYHENRDIFRKIVDNLSLAALIANYIKTESMTQIQKTVLLKKMNGYVKKDFINVLFIQITEEKLKRNIDFMNMVDTDQVDIQFRATYKMPKDWPQFVHSQEKQMYSYLSILNSFRFLEQ